MEVIIVLAVTGFLFVGAVLLISGRQQRTAFQLAARDVQSHIQGVINEVLSGFYPNLGTVQCSVGGSGPVLTTVANQEQGTNDACIYMGKALQFKVAGTDPEQILTFSLAGLRDADTLAAAQPVAVAPTPAGTPGQNRPNATAPYSLPGGMTVLRAWYESGGSETDIGTVAFVNRLVPSSGSSMQSGSLQVDLIPVSNSVLNQLPAQAAQVIDTHLRNSAPNPGGVYICFVSGGSIESALVTIGGGGRELSVDLRTMSNATCS